jgi:hypothetical protein
VTKLGDAIHKGAAAGKSPVTRLEAALAGKRPFKPVKVLVHGVPHDAIMTVIGSERSLDIEGEVARAMERRGLEQNVLTQGKFELELAWRTLAEAVLDSEQNPVPFGTAEQWGRLVPEVIGELWVQYAELRAEHDPQVAELTEDEVRDLRAAVSKKNGPALRYFGASRLSRFLLSSADLLASSWTERSSPGDSSPVT